MAPHRAGVTRPGLSPCPPGVASARPPAATGRLWEIDCSRTLAISMMISYHVVYDVDLVAPGLGPDPLTGAWGALPEATGSLFLLLVGVSLAVADGRGRAGGGSTVARARRHARRAIRGLGAALLVTVATLAVFPERYVRFGILHAIGVSALLAIPLLRLRRWNVALGVAVVVAGIAVGGEGSGFPGGLILGFPAPSFSSVDYWPLLPWFGVVLIGVGAGHALYPLGSRSRVLRRLSLPEYGRPRGIVARLGAPGRHSLPVYLAHQPILVVLVAAALGVAGVSSSPLPKWPGLAVLAIVTVVVGVALLRARGPLAFREAGSGGGRA